MFWDYLFFILLASFGVLQVAAAYARLSGLSFFRRRLWGYLLGVMALGGGFGWFFAAEERNAWPVLGEAQMFGLFLGAVVCVLPLTALIAGVVRARPGRESLSAGDGQQGLEELRTMTLFKALRRNRSNRRD